MQSVAGAAQSFSNMAIFGPRTTTIYPDFMPTHSIPPTGRYSVSVKYIIHSYHQLISGLTASALFVYGIITAFAINIQ
jgi:hypothetical protein